MLGEGWSPKLKEPGQHIEGRTRTEYPRKGDSSGWLQHGYVGYALFRRGHLIQTRPKMRKEKGRIIALGGEISGWSRAGRRPKTLQWTASHQSQEMISPRRTSDKLAGSSARNWRGYSDARERQEQRWCFPWWPEIPCSGAEGQCQDWWKTDQERVQAVLVEPPDEARSWQ